VNELGSAGFACRLHLELTQHLGVGVVVVVVVVVVGVEELVAERQLVGAG